MEKVEQGHYRTLVTRWCAYGDAIVAIPLVEELKRRSHYLHLETGVRGAEVFSDHRAVTMLSIFDVMKHGKDNSAIIANTRYQAMQAAGQFDKDVLLYRTLEVECIAEEWQEEFAWPRERRREHFGPRNFHEATFRKAGLSLPDPFDVGSMVLSEGQVKLKKDFLNRHREKYNIVMVVSGSTCQKVPYGLKELAEKILLHIPEAQFFLIGLKESGWMPSPIDFQKRQFSLGKGNVCHMVGKTDWSQIVAIIQAADYLIAPISAPAHIANLMGTPKTVVCTDCSVEQAFKYGKNDMSIQATAPCSPCHRAIYNTKCCLTRDGGDGLMPLCNFDWPHEEIVENVMKAYSKLSMKRMYTEERVDWRIAHTIPDFMNDELFCQPPYGRYGFKKIEEIFKDKPGAEILEIGGTRDPLGPFLDGYSTVFFAYLAKKYGHRFTSVDIDPNVTRVSKELISMLGLGSTNTQLITADGHEFIKQTPKVFDVVYLDGWDYGPDDWSRKVLTWSEANHLLAAQAISKKTNPGAVIMIDDMCAPKSLAGKGTLASPWLQSIGYRPIYMGWEYVLQAKGDGE